VRPQKAAGRPAPARKASRASRRDRSSSGARKITSRERSRAARDERTRAAGKARSAARGRKVASREVGRRTACPVRRGKRRCPRAPAFQGHGVPASALRREPLPRPSGEIWLFSANLGEEIKVKLYDEDGEFDDAALARLDRAFRCRRTGEARAVDPRLYEILSLMQDHFGKRRIDLVSGFRFQQNEGSRHYHASAMDIRIAGVTSREIYEYAESLDAGGMGIGIYPTSGFVHVDFRAPGEPSYRWTDHGGPGTRNRGRDPSKYSRRRQPTS
jgi:uncharacterized protein YcbK (DUF882 family)